jgi:hypothetical protein
MQTLGELGCVGAMDTHATIHGVWVCNERHKCYTIKILLHLHKCVPCVILGWFVLDGSLTLTKFVVSNLFFF